MRATRAGGHRPGPPGAGSPGPDQGRHRPGRRAERHRDLGGRLGHRHRGVHWAADRPQDRGVRRATTELSAGLADESVVWHLLTEAEESFPAAELDAPQGPSPRASDDDYFDDMRMLRDDEGGEPDERR
ncbi:hypothetical protein [Kibdelosporangium phytohabitans]|uniref:hypothetical protein n=1 Tax=Kibdelosporangium phytohabitans TaxID=860235 RepID=UPI0012F8A2ED|nr:hypothetical protein [Kibdelosporangium phytohabitans]MBE1463073.1 hypothetical protein [Kibdelosporangium phytohabitans]